MMGVVQNFMPISFDQSMDEAFPEIDPGHRPFGSRVIVQIRTAKSKSRGGIELTTETRETVAYNTQIAKVRAVGPLAFRNRETQKPWPEGDWVQIGDYVRIPKYNDDRWERPIPGTDDHALFAIVNDLDLRAGLTVDPRDIIAFI